MHVKPDGLEIGWVVKPKSATLQGHTLNFILYFKYLIDDLLRSTSEWISSPSGQTLIPRIEFYSSDPPLNPIFPNRTWQPPFTASFVFKYSIALIYGFWRALYEHLEFISAPYKIHIGFKTAAGEICFAVLQNTAAFFRLGERIRW